MSKPEPIDPTCIRASAEAIREAITTSAFTRRYFLSVDILSDWQKGAA